MYLCRMCIPKWIYILKSAHCKKNLNFYHPGTSHAVFYLFSFSWIHLAGTAKEKGKSEWAKQGGSKIRWMRVGWDRRRINGRKAESEERKIRKGISCSLSQHHHWVFNSSIHIHLQNRSRGSAVVAMFLHYILTMYKYHAEFLFICLSYCRYVMYMKVATRVLCFNESNAQSSNLLPL